MKGEYLLKVNVVPQILVRRMPANLGFAADERPFRPTKWVLKALKWVLGV